MRITVLTVPDCPNASVAEARIALALADPGRDTGNGNGSRGGNGNSTGTGTSTSTSTSTSTGTQEPPAPDIVRIEVTDPAEAARLGMTGSPTVLIDGTDPFTTPGTPASVSCRLYRGPDGTVDGAPSVPELRRALGLARAAAASGHPPLGAAARGGRGRLAPATGGLRAVQQAVLRHFAATGRAPEPAALDTVAAEHGRTAADVLSALAAEDFLTLDPDARIRAAYPFSAVPTPHRVRLPDGTRFWSMCAIDALGIPEMLGTDAVITSSDPVTGERITITATEGLMTWQPSEAMVYAGERSGDGPASEVTCGALNFFAGPASALAWAAAHPDYTGRAITPGQAASLGRAIFGELLR
ncbi:alkylmercury lyase family protein [Streptomyces sp. NPDC004609]|uniref:alkylmercury lyase family protein n=1 Tax=Streptomyces sp. NPDC004609 TaxID=3364704 RepID=UPI00368280E9